VPKHLIDVNIFPPLDRSSRLHAHLAVYAASGLVSGAAFAWAMVTVLRARWTREVRHSDVPLLLGSLLLMSFGGWVVPVGPVAVLGYLAGRHAGPGRRRAISHTGA
jgi:hypothetical protein